jgi:hypothetical protein
MKHGSILALLAACGVIAFAGAPVTGASWIAQAYADGPRTAKARSKRHRAVKVRGFLQRGGYYSYIDNDVINTYAWPRGLYSSTSAFRTPFTNQQSPAGPFDSGFFFDSGLGPPFNDAPYPR